MAGTPSMCLLWVNMLTEEAMDNIFRLNLVLCCFCWWWMNKLNIHLMHAVSPAVSALVFAPFPDSHGGTERGSLSEFTLASTWLEAARFFCPLVYGPWEMPTPVWSCTSGPGKLHVWSSSTSSAVALRSPCGLVRRAKLVNSQPLCSGRSRLARGDLTVYKLYNLNQGRVRFTAEQEVAVGTTRPVPTVWGTVEQRPQKSKGSSQVWVQDSSSPWTKSGSQFSCGESALAACLWGRLETEVMLGLFYWVWNPASSETWHSLCS